MGKAFFCGCSPFLSRYSFFCCAGIDAARRRIEVAWSALWEAKTAPCDASLQEQIARAIAAEGIEVQRLPSGAGHDGMALIDLAPIGMLFVRCKEGISHNPAESVTEADVATGARALLRVIESFVPPRAEARR